MGWFQKLLPPKIKRREGEDGKKNVPEGLWHKCPNCQAVLYHSDLEKNQSVCPKCSHHHRITARTRLDLLLDSEGRFEIGAEVLPIDTLKFKDSRRYADRLIAASEGEGFGLPLIEAVQHKLPIIARDIPVFREVAGEHAFYFCGLEPVDLANAISGWLGLNSKGLAPKSDEMPWLTWRESARQLIARIDSLTTIPTTKDKK